jgi:hypothetical protein
MWSRIRSPRVSAAFLRSLVIILSS